MQKQVQRIYVRFNGRNPEVEGSYLRRYHDLVSTLTETQRHAIVTTIQEIRVRTDALEYACVVFNISLEGSRSVESMQNFFPPADLLWIRVRIAAAT